MRVSIVIVNWNTKALLADCLASIEANPPAGAYEVIVVDNGSTDGSVETVRESFPQVRLLVNGDNAGFAGANNQGIAHSSGAYVLLLNSDTVVRPGALEELLRFMEDNRGAGAAGARLLNPDGTLQDSCSPLPTLLREGMHLFHLDYHQRREMQSWGTEQARPVDVLLGACLLVRREALEQVGPMDEGYFMYSEEVDYCRRLQDAGWTLHWVPQAEIVHYGGQSTRQVATEMFLRLYAAKLRYFRKHDGRRAGQLYKLILFAAALFRLLLLPLALLAPPHKRREQFSLAGRYWQLVRALPAF
jgi:N-acetylglucosaminyl-diphospho-decaprenol L-rhamnosyltransferase